MIAILDFRRIFQLPYLGSSNQPLFIPPQKLLNFHNFEIARGDHLGFSNFVTNVFIVTFETYKNPLYFTLIGFALSFTLSEIQASSPPVWICPPYWIHKKIERAKV
jgi:hypothetical protein